MKKVKFGLLLGASFLGNIGAANAQQVVQVGYGFSSPNNSSIDPKTNLPQGTMIDVINSIAKDAGFQIQFHPLLDADIGPALNAKIIDIGVVNNITPLVQGVVLKPFGTYCCNEGLFVLKSDAKEYKSINDLSGATIAIHPAFLAAIQKAGLFADAKSLTTADALKAVATGQVKAAVVPVTLGSQFQGGYPEVQIVRSYVGAIPVSGFGFQVRQADTELLTKIEKSGAKLIADGTVKATYAKYGQEWTAPK